MIDRFTPATPIPMQPGDTFVRLGRFIQQWRGTELIATHDTSQMDAHVVDIDVLGTTSITAFYLERKMPGVNVAIVGVTENQTSGAVTFKFASGNQVELPDWPSAGSVADTVDANEELAQNILIGKSFRASPDGANKTNQVGASASVNLQADVPIVYTEPQ